MDTKRKADVSPITFAGKDDPALLLVYGDADQIVPLQHAKDLHEKSKKVGIVSELLVVKGAGHNVGGQKVTERVMAFIREQLKVGPR